MTSKDGVRSVEIIDPTTSLTESDLKHAARVTCGYARDADEATMFLAMLGLDAELKSMNSSERV